MDRDTHYFDGKNVLVFGLGVNGGGLGTLAFLLSTEAQSITVTDQKTEADFLTANITLPTDVHIVWSLGQHQESDFTEADIVVKNPSIPWSHPLVLLAKKSGAEVVMDSTIFMALCPAPVIGVTGSKGKTTTASLIAHILESAGYPVVRVGISQTGVLSELPKVTKSSVVVFELSSWRLSGLQSIGKSPSISVLTNLYPDHLNYYGSMEAYAKDKKIITEFQSSADFFILPEKSEWTGFFIESCKAHIQTFGTSDQSSAWQDDQNLWIRWQDTDTKPDLLLKKEDSLLSGEHFLSNMLAAALAAKSFGVSLADIQKGLGTFSGVPHRFELIRIVDDVRYINDTTATIPSATLASVESLRGPVILLAGGSDKGLPLDDLVRAIAKTKSTILFAGTGTDTILKALPQELHETVSVATSMKEAVTQAKEATRPGDTVLLAPGAASFGMFKNEFDRGTQFIDAVKSLSGKV